MQEVRYASEEIQNLSPELRTFFTQGERLSFMENQMIEYKQYAFPFDDLRRKILKEVICSFLNTKGGFIFIGIDDKENQIYGIRLTLPQKDAFKREIFSIVERSFHPKLDLIDNPMVTIDFIPLRDQRQFIAGQWVVRITVQKGSKFYVIVEHGKFIAYKRMDGRKLTIRDTDVYDEIEKCTLQESQIEKLKYSNKIEKGIDLFENNQKQFYYQGNNAEKQSFLWAFGNDSNSQVDKQKKVGSSKIMFLQQQNDLPIKDVLEQFLTIKSKNWQIDEKERAIICEDEESMKEISSFIKNKQEDLDEMKVFKSITEQRNGEILYRGKCAEQLNEFGEQKGDLIPKKLRESMICIEDLNPALIEKFAGRLQEINLNNNLPDFTSVALKDRTLFAVFSDYNEARNFKQAFVKMKRDLSREFSQNIWLNICNLHFRIEIVDSELQQDVLSQLNIQVDKNQTVSFKSFSEGIELYQIIKQTFKTLGSEVKINWN